METPDLRDEKYNSLARRVACSDQRHILTLAEFGFDGRGPVSDTGPLEGFEISASLMTIFETRSDDYASREERPAVFQFDFQRICRAPTPSPAFPFIALELNSDFCPKFLRLVE